MVEALLKKLNTSTYSKAAIAYLICEVLVRGIGFISTPIFTRIMEVNAYGQFSNFVAWEALLMPIFTMNLRVTISKSKYDYKDNDTYLSSILFASNMITVFFFIVFELNKVFFCDLIGMDVIFVRLIFVYLLFWPAFSFQQIQYQMQGKYKLYVGYTIMSTVCRFVLSIALVLFMEDQLLGRALGYVMPAILVYLIIYINIWYKGKRVDFKRIKYGLAMSIPLLPSAFSVTLLSSSDQIMIKRWCGDEDIAIYAVAYTISSIAGIIWTAINQAWSPWFMDNLNAKRYEEIKVKSDLLQKIYCAVIVLFMLFAPEIIWIMGGESYKDALILMPPVILAMVCQFFYSYYFNTEYFFGETYTISFGTALAAIINVILNVLFIPHYGYVAASYTTLIGYAVMLIYHYCIVHYKLRKSDIFNNKSFLKSIIILVICQIGIQCIYNKTLLRYGIILLYVFMIIGVGYILIRRSLNGKDIVNE